MKLINYNGKYYPQFQAEGNAAKFIIPFAKEVCIGEGLDIGCGKKEWAFLGAIPVDPEINGWDDLNLPEGKFDYIFSSHCLEHVNNYVDTLIYWRSKIRSGGTLFMYLPDYSQEYWRPWNNRKHKHIFTPKIIKDCLESLMYQNIFVSGVDLNNSFTVIATIR